MPYLFHSSPVDPPIPADAGSLPQEVGGLPAFYYWRCSIADGTYRHPLKGWELTVDLATRSTWETTFRAMRAAGIEIPILADHKAAAAATLGYVIDIRQQGPWLQELHQYLGTEARDIALRNRVSVAVTSDFVDSSGNHYGQAIIHSAIVPHPLVPGQPLPVAADSVDASPACTASAQDEALDLLVLSSPATGDPSSIADSAELPRHQSIQLPVITASSANEQISAIPANIHPADLDSHSQQTAATLDPSSLPAEDLSALADDLSLSSADAEQPAQLSLSSHSQPASAVDAISSGDTPMHPSSIDAKSISTRPLCPQFELDRLLLTGHITPATRDRFCAIFDAMDSSATDFHLSMQGNPQSLAQAILLALQANTPFNFSAQTAIQVLPRTIPDSADLDDTAAIDFGRVRAARLNP